MWLRPSILYWFDGLLYEPSVPNCPSYLVKIISSYLYGWTFQVSFRSAISASHDGGWHGAWCNFPCPLQSMSATCLCHPTMSSWHPTLTTRPSYSCPTGQRSTYWPRAVAEGKGGLHQHLEKSGDALRGACPLSRYAHYLGVILDTRMTCSTHIRQVRHRPGGLVPLLNWRNACSSSFPCWTMCVPSGGWLLALVNNPQVLQSKCLHFVTIKSWYTGNRQILRDLGFPLFAEHIRPLAERLG